MAAAAPWIDGAVLSTRRNHSRNVVVSLMIDKWMYENGFLFSCGGKIVLDRQVNDSLDKRSCLQIIKNDEEMYRTIVVSYKDYATVRLGI
jgi:hypothetical protein